MVYYTIYSVYLYTYTIKYTLDVSGLIIPQNWIDSERLIKQILGIVTTRTRCVKSY